MKQFFSLEGAVFLLLMLIPLGCIVGLIVDPPFDRWRAAADCRRP